MKLIDEQWWERDVLLCLVYSTSSESLYKIVWWDSGGIHLGFRLFIFGSIM